MATAVRKAFIKEWVYVYGPPLILFSENGKRFVAKVFQDVCRIFGVKKVFTMTNHRRKTGRWSISTALLTPLLGIR